MAEDCKAVGFSGEGRCIEPAGISGYCVEHQKCVHCHEQIDRHGAAGNCTKGGYYGNRFTYPADATVSDEEAVALLGVVEPETRSERIADIIGLPRNDPAVLTAIREEKAEQAEREVKTGVKVPRVNYTQLPSQREYSTAHYALNRLHETAHRDGYQAGHADARKEAADEVMVHEAYALNAHYEREAMRAAVRKVLEDTEWDDWPGKHRLERRLLAVVGEAPEVEPVAEAEPCHCIGQPRRNAADGMKLCNRACPVLGYMDRGVPIGEVPGG